MKALIKSHARRGLCISDTKFPELGENEILVRINKTAICGTDLHIYKWDDWAKKTIPVPMIIGHEFVGEVIGFGACVEQFKVGDRVSGEGHLVCGFCRNCRAGKAHLCRSTKGIGVNSSGAFAEYIVIPEFNAFHVPDEIPDHIAAILDPFGNAVHTALAFDVAGEDVLVTGAGPIGIMAAIVARHCGARRVVLTDINDYRLALARKLGFQHVINSKEQELSEYAAQIGLEEGFDIGLEMSGVPAAFSSMLNVMNHGGKIALLGILPDDTAIDWGLVIFKGLHIKGIYGREMFETWHKMKAMLLSGLSLEGIITHQFDFEDFEEAFELFESGHSGKILLNWNPK